MPGLDFSASRPLTLGIELELQLVNTEDFDLAPRSGDVLAGVQGRTFPGEIKQEMTLSMMEISTGICRHPRQALDELREIQSVLLAAADPLGVAVAGGGTHPFQRWDEQILVEDSRGLFLADTYGYLCHQLTVFGQHVHVGCPGADEAMGLLHSLSRYIPHFIALAAASPYVRGVDTTFDSARLNAFGSFPMAGRAPYVFSWSEFNTFFEKMKKTRVIRSMKDFYWDIRPKPEYGTVEVRVMDTPLTIEKACNLAGYLQALARWLLVEKPHQITEDFYLFYDFNRFQACRHGLDAVLVEEGADTPHTIRDDIRATMAKIESHAIELEVDGHCGALLAAMDSEGNDASWLRQQRDSGLTLPQLVEQQCRRWRGP
ncbi:MAG TPA: YbdK family carboxylate-amine ligase [Moraxellaceae bacterium]